MPLKSTRVPLATEFLNRDATLSKDSRIINGYVEKYYDGRTAVIKRPGLVSFAEHGFSAGQGIISHQGNLVTVVGNKVYSTNLSGGVQSIGTNNEVVSMEVLSLPLSTWPNVGINSTMPPVSTATPTGSISGNASVRADLGGLPAVNIAENFLLIKGTNVAYFWNGYDKNLTQIVDVNYPATTVPGIAQLDGSVYVMDPNGTLYNSQIQDMRTWNSLDFITAEVEPDGGVAIAKYLNYILAFGNYSLEFFYDAANPTGSPLLRVDNAFSPVGCANGNSVVAMDSTVVWVSQTKEDNAKVGRGREVMALRGMSPKKISTPFIDRILANDDLAHIRAFTFKSQGHDFYVLTLVDSSITLVYDMTMNLWYQWTGNSRMDYFLTSSCSIGRTVISTTTQDRQFLINNSATGVFFQFELINNQYITTFQNYFHSSDTTIYVYDLLFRQVNTLTISGIGYNNMTAWSINQNYSGQIAYFNTSDINGAVILEVNLYTGIINTIHITDPILNVSTTSNVDPTGTYVLEEAFSGAGTGDLTVTRVTLATGAKTILTTVLSANNVVNLSTSRLGTFIYNNVAYIPFKATNQFGLHKYNLTTGAFIADVTLSTNASSVLISADVQNGFLSFKDGATNLTTVYNLNTGANLITGLPNFGNPNLLTGTSFILVDTINQLINSYDGADFRVYNYSGVLQNSIIGIFSQLSASDPPVYSAFLSSAESFYAPAFHTNLNGVDYLLDYGTGTTWKTSEFYYADGTQSIPFHVITPNMDAGNNHTKFITRLDIIGDKAAGNLNISYSKNDYLSWIPYRTVNLNLDRVKIHRLGKCRRIAFEFYCTDSIPLRLEAYEVHVDGGEEH